MTTDANAWDIERIRAAHRGWLVEYHASITSTNDRAREIAAAAMRGASAIVLADEQTAGRGRGAHRWWTGRGSLAMSVLVDATSHGVAPASLPIVSLAAGLAVVDTAAELLAVERLGLHWPNDVFASGRKMAGILVEGLPDGRQIIGIGVNVNNSLAAAPWEVRDVATSMIDLAGRTFDRSTLVVEIIERLSAAIDQLARSPVEVARRADARCLQHGQLLSIRVGHRTATGVCRGIADDGALVLATDVGDEGFYSGFLIHSDRQA